MHVVSGLREGVGGQQSATRLLTFSLFHFFTFHFLACGSKDSQRAPGSHPKFGSFEDFCSQCRDECPLASTPRALLPRRPHAALGGLLRDHEDRYAPLGWPRGVVPPRAVPSLQVFVCGRGSSTLCGARQPLCMYPVASPFGGMDPAHALRVSGLPPRASRREIQQHTPPQTTVHCCTLLQKHAGKFVCVMLE